MHEVVHFSKLLFLEHITTLEVLQTSHVGGLKSGSKVVKKKKCLKFCPGFKTILYLHY